VLRKKEHIGQQERKSERKEERKKGRNLKLSGRWMWNACEKAAQSQKDVH
jgi:hypothetical protein